MPDVRVESHGTIVLLRPLSDKGRSFVGKQFSEQDMWGGAVACDSRMVDAIIDGMRADGMEVVHGFQMPEGDEE